MKTCKLDDCHLKSHTLGYCSRHGYRFQMRGDPYWEPSNICMSKNCSNLESIKPSNGLCQPCVGGQASRKFWQEKWEELPVGSKKKNSHGYMLVRVSEDTAPVLEHRFLMEQLLGRPLTVGENVHHKNGDRSDNRIENLELWTLSQPAGQRVEDKIKWAINFIKLYKPELLKDQNEY